MPRSIGSAVIGRQSSRSISPNNALIARVPPVCAPAFCVVPPSREPLHLGAATLKEIE